jgi:hypothetical protein
MKTRSSLEGSAAAERAAPSAKLDRNEHPNDHPKAAREHGYQEVKYVIRARPLSEYRALARLAELLSRLDSHGPSKSVGLSLTSARLGHVMFFTGLASRP